MYICIVIIQDSEGLSNLWRNSYMVNNFIIAFLSINTNFTNLMLLIFLDVSYIEEEHQIWAVV